MMTKQEIISGDCLEVIPTLPEATMIWADPPDNIRVDYVDYKDRMDSTLYIRWLTDVMKKSLKKTNLIWLSYNKIYQHLLPFNMALRLDSDVVHRQFIWHYTFGPNQQSDFVSSYRTILRIAKEGKAEVYPNAVRIPSQRQIAGDKRADPRGKLPDDVWEFPRVCGTHKERKKWIPNQHPKALLRRIVLFSTQPGDTVIDMFAGSGNMLEVCHELGRNCIGIEISPYYCERIKENLRRLQDE